MQVNECFFEKKGVPHRYTLSMNIYAVNCVLLTSGGDYTIFAGINFSRIFT